MAKDTQWQRFYVPEIHDVWPGMERALDAMLDVLPAAARARAALLVVPNWQGRAPLDAAVDFIGRLREMPGEKVLHGYTHSLGPDLVNWLLYGHDNRSEFARLAEEEAGKRLAAGVATFEAAFSQRPRWFCAPRWQQSPAVARALAANGFAGWMLNGALVRAARGQVVLPAINFDEGDRKIKNAFLHRLRRAKLRKILAAAAPVRLSLHPADVQDPVAWRQVRDLMSSFASDGWVPLSIDEAIARWDARARLAA